ncbi:MAG TPA: hypothetical protein PLM79_01705 [Syntrophobacteraceae bacterium]|nr:hypothetical protein [Syntrophobacteraceae bacterium]
MEWTKTKPKKEGWYWYLYTGNPEDWPMVDDPSQPLIVEVTRQFFIDEDLSLLLFWLTGSDEPWRVYEAEGFWYGPLLPPPFPEILQHTDGGNGGT